MPGRLYAQVVSGTGPRATKLGPRSLPGPYVKETKWVPLALQIPTECGYTALADLADNRLQEVIPGAPTEICNMKGRVVVSINNALQAEKIQAAPIRWKGKSIPWSTLEGNTFFAAGIVGMPRFVDLEFLRNTLQKLVGKNGRVGRIHIEGTKGQRTSVVYRVGLEYKQGRPAEERLFSLPKESRCDDQLELVHWSSVKACDGCGILYAPLRGREYRCRCSPQPAANPTPTTERAPTTESTKQGTGKGTSAQRAAAKAPSRPHAGQTASKQSVARTPSASSSVEASEVPQTAEQTAEQTASEDAMDTDPAPTSEAQAATSPAAATKANPTAATPKQPATPIATASTAEDNKPFPKEPQERGRPAKARIPDQGNVTGPTIPPQDTYEAQSKYLENHS
ncbi:hypothetical protein GQ54DRAFT_333321 [Martensiomyces pterosporus]|nr:hypothetical protein GQ54DRAFT_333321 [Martensiomyces pterosporus]